MKTYSVTTEVTLERVYTVQARTEEDARAQVEKNLCTRWEDLETSEEVQSVEEDEE